MPLTPHSLLHGLAGEATSSQSCAASPPHYGGSRDASLPASDLVDSLRYEQWLTSGSTRCSSANGGFLQRRHFTTKTTLNTTHASHSSKPFKLVVLGAAEVGKTALVARLRGLDEFPEKHRPTVEEIHIGEDELCIVSHHRPSPTSSETPNTCHEANPPPQHHPFSSMASWLLGSSSTASATHHGDKSSYAVNDQLSVKHHHNPGAGNSVQLNATLTVEIMDTSGT